MKKKNFITLIMGTVGGILFALGMCMCLLPQWNAFRQGVVVGVIGVAELLVMVLIRRKMEGKPAIQLNKKAVGTIVFGMIGALVFGTGMCMVMVWESLLVPGIIVGIVGIVFLICLYPLCRGLK